MRESVLHRELMTSVGTPEQPQVGIDLKKKPDLFVI